MVLLLDANVEVRCKTLPSTGQSGNSKEEIKTGTFLFNKNS